MKTTFRVVNTSGLVSSHTRIPQAKASAVRNGGRIWRETPTVAHLWLFDFRRREWTPEDFANYLASR
jgi:hypothetical protein